MLLNYIGEVESDHIQDFTEFWMKKEKGNKSGVINIKESS